MTTKTRVLNAVKHLLIGFALTLKGIDKLSHHGIIGSILLCFGIIILIYFIYTLFNKHHSERLSLLMHWFEAFAALFTAYIYFTEGATYLQYAFLLAAIGFFIAIFMHYKKHRAHQ